MPQSTILEINTGRVASVRLGPNEDLVEALDQAAAHLGFRRALVKSGLGSLIDATFVGAEGKPRRIEGPAVELLSLSGGTRGRRGPLRVDEAAPSERQPLDPRLPRLPRGREHGCLPCLR